MNGPLIFRKLHFFIVIIPVVVCLSGCPSWFGGGNQSPPIATTPTCSILITNPVVLTNPISQNLSPTLQAQVVGFPKHASLTYAWSIANVSGGGTLHGSGKSVEFDMYSMTVAMADVVLNFSSGTGQTALCDVEIQKQQSQSR